MQTLRDIACEHVGCSCCGRPLQLTCAIVGANTQVSARSPCLSPETSRAVLRGPQGAPLLAIIARRAAE